TVSASGGTHRARVAVPSTMVGGGKYRLTGTYRLPSTNTIVDGFSIIGLNAKPATTDTNVSFSIDIDDNEGSYITLQLFDGASSVFMGNGTDVVYLRALALRFLGAFDAPNTQPGLTTGDAFARFSRRLVGISSHPLTDRGTLYLNTATSGDE